MTDPIEITNDEWVEIYYAVVDKLERIAADHDEPDDQLISSWIATFSSILRKIGTDGAVAAQVGVRRCMGISASEQPCDLAT